MCVIPDIAVKGGKCVSVSISACASVCRSMLGGAVYQVVGIHRLILSR